MIVKKIKEIKNIDAFDLFEWQGEDFKKFNLVYGWNGAGKTTISRLFYSLENREISSKLGLINFQIQTEGDTIKEQDIKSHSVNIKVFNEDFINDNLKFSESKAKKILIVGKESGDAASIILELENKQKEDSVNQEQLISQRKKIPDLDMILREAGNEVVKQFSNTPLGSGIYSGRIYDKRKIAPLIENGTISLANLDSLIIIKQEDIDKKREIIKSQKQEIKFNPQKIKDLSSLFEEANSLLGIIIEVDNIEELKDKEIRSWVESGYHLHKNRGFNKCQFCQNIISPEYLERLGRFFTKELEDAQKLIDEKINAIDVPELKGEIDSVESMSLFPDLSVEYLSKKSFADSQGVTIRAAIEKITESLKEKRENLNEKEKIYEPIVYPSKEIENFNETVDKISEIIYKQNEQISKVSEAAKEIELHAIATELKAKNYFQKKEEAINLDNQIKKNKEELERLAEEIGKKRLSILNANIAIEKINNILKEFFGESHIYLEPDTEGEEMGYILKRRKKNANNLSQGEKSVIALAYFLTKLEEEGFDITKSFIILDDPVDSQDEIFLFKTFGLIKGYLSHVGQLVILTHNFPFFNLIRDWFVRENKKSEDGELSELFSINCYKSPTKNEVKIEPLNDLLKNYKTEYQYLFYQLYNFKKGCQNIDEPIVPNIGRKVLEYFASFKWSCDMGEEFANIIHNRFKDEPKERKEIVNFIEKFIQEYSHGKDFTRPISASTFEAKSVAENIIKFIEITDKDHFERIIKICDKR